MDESTNALDFDSEKKIILEIMRLNIFETVFFITHREKMLRFCDLILSVNDSTIKKLDKIKVSNEK